MNPKVKELRQKRAAIVQEMHDLTEQTTYTAEASKRWKELDVQQETIKAQIDSIERQETLNQEMRTISAPPVAAIEDPANTGTRTLTAVSKEAETREFTSEEEKRYFEMRNSQEYRKSFWRYMRDRRSDSRADKILDECLVLESRAYAGLGGATSAADGYYLIPIGFQREIERKMISFGGIRRNARILNTSTGNLLNWPTEDDTANVGNWVAEAGGVSQANPIFANIPFNAYLASSKQVLVSVQLLQDSAFDIEANLSESFAIRLSRIANAGYTNGTGTGQPKGLLTSIEADAVPLVVTANGAANNDGSVEDGSNSIGTDDISDLIAKLDPMYRVGAKFMAHWSIYDYLRKLKDKYGRPQWETSMSQGSADKLFGYEYDWNADMATWTQGAGESGANASLYTMLFGDFSKYIVREVGGITMVRYNELYMPNHQVGFQAFLRTEGQRIQPAAFSLLQQASS